MWLRRQWKEQSRERQEEKSQKSVILKKVCTKAQKADNKLTYSMPFDWAEEVNTFVSPTCIIHETVPSANIIPSRDTSPIVPIEAAPTVPVEPVLINKNTIVAH